MALAPRLPEGLLAQALDAARALTGQGARAEALGALAPRLPEGLLAQALDAARAIHGEYARARVLGALAPELPEPQQAGVYAEALDAARALTGQGVAPGLGVAPWLPEGLLAQADAARALTDEDARAWVLGELRPGCRRDCWPRRWTPPAPSPTTVLAPRRWGRWRPAAGAATGRGLRRGAGRRPHPHRR